ncbi:hypothetical protein Tco_0644232 [Tanacetum coccineum]
MTGINKMQYTASVRVTIYLLQAIPNDIYNSVDACKNAQQMWAQIKRFMYGVDVTKVRHSRLMDEFDKFAAKKGESLESVYERLTILVNIMDRNDVRPIPVSINTKFLNCLQLEWSKYVTMIRQNQTVTEVAYDQLYDSLLQFEPHVQASKAKRAARTHDLLALIAHSNAYSSQSHASPSYSHSPQPYYVIHPSSVVDYEEDYQRGVTRGFSRRQAYNRNDDGRVDIQTKNAGYGGNGNRNAGRQNRNQAFNAGNGLTQNDESNQIVQRVPQTESNPGKENVQSMKDEAGSNLKDEENDFMLDNSYGDETLEELIDAIIMMARIQPADDNTMTKPKYDAKAVSEVNASHKMISKGVHEHKNHGKRKTVINTSDDDQIDSNIIFDDPYVENNGVTSELDLND